VSVSRLHVKSPRLDAVDQGRSKVGWLEAIVVEPRGGEDEQHVHDMA
jgi:hypothetical protein